MTITHRDNVGYLLSWVGRVMIAGFGVVCGSTLAMFSLAARPVEVVKKAPTAEELASDRVFYQPGARDSTRGRLWASKRKAIFSGESGVVALNEEELNSWFSSTLRTPPSRNPKAPPPDIVAEGVNFRIADGVFQVGLPIQVNYFAEPLRTVLQAKGAFEVYEGRWYFLPDEVWLGSLPAHRIPGFVSFLIEKQLDESWVPADALAAWKRIREMQVDDRLVQLRLE